jgi:hypothetical protein
MSHVVSHKYDSHSICNKKNLLEVEDSVHKEAFELS